MFSPGDKVRHRSKPEWGVGTISKIEVVTLKGVRDQRLTIRFPNAGLKTLLAGVADLEAFQSTSPAAARPSGETLLEREAGHERGWLGEIAKKQPEDAMGSVPASATDPFLPLEKRVAAVLAMYRFEPALPGRFEPALPGRLPTEGVKLIDWAVAQSGLDDPLARFTRHELETFYGRFAFERDALLVRYLGEAKKAGADTAANVDALLKTASPAAQRALQKRNAHR